MSGVSGGWEQLSRRQRRALRERLLRRREQLESWPERHDPPLAPEQDGASAASRQRALADLDRALASIADGSYGSCPSCGGSVGLANLAEHPLGTDCVVCRQALEQRHVVP